MVYAQLGTSNQQIGGEIPEGWIVMMLAKDEGADVIAGPDGFWIGRVPVAVSRFQGREAMHQTPHGDGTLFDAAEAVLAHSDTPAMYRRAWDELQEFRRDSEMLAAIAGVLDLTGAQIDALFILAVSIKA
ncbi:hypothetical protein [Achromobacter animicus]|uniref:hypothetical protein n=1 Tax=Achromobacter animicus TaxID=1389935 RepID=UPI0014660137|nr:hypothetical protein [Achromobacter animicus]CAB3850684.1 hypothetical protein LMG26691_01967 [Achromobacter animicus]